MSEFIPLKDGHRVLVDEDFISHGDKSNLAVKFEPTDVKWKPTRADEPAIGKEPLLHFLSGTGCLLGEVRKGMEGEDDITLVQTADIVQHFFANKFNQTIPHLHKTMVPVLHYGPEVSITEVTVPSSAQGMGELRRAATCFLQTLDPRWVSTSEVFRRYDPFTDDASWSVWDTALDGRCKCNLVCLLFRTKSDLGLELNVGNAIVSIALKEKGVRIPGTCDSKPSEVGGIVPELAESDLCEIAVNDTSFVVANTEVAMLHLSTASLQGILDVMIMTICYCNLGGTGLPLKRQSFMDVNCLRHKSDICRLDTENVPELPEKFRYLLHVVPDDESEKPVPPPLLHFKEMEGRVARGLKHRRRFEVGSYVEMHLMKNDESSVPAALGIIAHLPETNPIRKVVLRGKEYSNERFVGVCFMELLDAKYGEVKYDMGLKDRTGYEIQTIKDFVVGEEYLWDLCYLSPLHHHWKLGNDVKDIMESAKSQFLERWNSKHKEEYTAEHPHPPNWRRWDMEDRTLVPIEL